MTYIGIHLVEHAGSGMTKRNMSSGERIDLSKVRNSKNLGKLIHSFQAKCA